MTVRPPWAVDGVSAAGADIRLASNSVWTPEGALRVREGAVGAPIVVSAQPTPNRTVSVPAFSVIVDNDNFASGSVTVINDGPVTVPIDAFDTSPRKDIIVVGWIGEEQGVSLRDADIYVIKGTPATNPVAPAVPANSHLLATIQVPVPPATVITNTNISNTLLQTTTIGGITPSRNSVDVKGAYAGQYRDRLDANGRLERYDGTRWNDALARVLPSFNAAVMGAAWDGQSDLAHQLGTYVGPVQNSSGGLNFAIGPFSHGILYMSFTMGDSSNAPFFVAPILNNMAAVNGAYVSFNGVIQRIIGIGPTTSANAVVRGATPADGLFRVNFDIWGW